jgi:hypothetical protein
LSQRTSLPKGGDFSFSSRSTHITLVLSHITPLSKKEKKGVNYYFSVDERKKVCAKKVFHRGLFVDELKLIRNFCVVLLSPGLFSLSSSSSPPPTQHKEEVTSELIVDLKKIIVYSKKLFLEAVLFFWGGLQ